MNLFHKNSMPFICLLLDDSLHLTYGQNISLAISMCLKPLTHVTWIRDWHPPSNSRPLSLHFAISVMTSPSHSCGNWYSICLNPPCNNPLMTWRFMGHTSLASSSVTPLHKTHFTNVISLALICRILFSSHMHLNLKCANIVRSQPD